MQVEAETYVVNQSWNANGVTSNLADSIGLMVYEGKTSLDYVKNYVNGADQWGGSGMNQLFTSDHQILKSIQAQTFQWVY